MDEEVYRSILQEMAEGVYFVDRERQITYWNPGAERITGYSADEVVGRSCSDGILRHVNDHGTQLCLAGCPLAGVMRDGSPRGADVYLHHRDGHRVPVTVRGHAIRNQAGDVVGSVELFHVRPATRFAGQTPTDRSTDYDTDPVTGIGTRRFGELNLGPVMSAVAAGSTSLGVLFIDVDHFKAVNDTYGHRIGDRVLRMVGQDLANTLRSSDFPIRWGGEEFVALLPGADPDGLLRVAERIRMLVEHSWIDDGSAKVRVTASVGATLALPEDSAETLIDRADRLMYDSKNAGRNRVTSDVT